MSESGGVVRGMPGQTLRLEGAALLGVQCFAHIGFDGMMGCGLKCPDRFQHPHLGAGLGAGLGTRRYPG